MPFAGPERDMRRVGELRKMLPRVKDPVAKASMEAAIVRLERRAGRNLRNVAKTQKKRR